MPEPGLSARDRQRLLTRRARGRAGNDAASTRAAESEYLAWLRPVPVARCPFTGAEVPVSIDTADIDGPFWDYNRPIRKWDEVDTLHFFAMSGSLKLNGRPSSTIFPVLPGPEVPYLIPRILEHPSVRAVVSRLAVGPHIGHLVTYFADQVPYDLPRTDTWGAPACWYWSEDGELVFDESDPQEEVLDFDLAPWIAAGKLAWIAPDDAGLVLRETVADCPYIGLAGQTAFQFLIKGRATPEVATPPPLLQATSAGEPPGNGTPSQSG